MPELVPRPKEPTVSPAPIVTLEPREAIIGLLMAPSREGLWFAPVSGKTRLIKELFLLQRETPAGLRGSFAFGFVAGKYGPFSPAAYDQLDELVAAGFIVNKWDDRNRVRGLMLTDSGRLLAIRAWKSKFDSDLHSAFFSVKSNYNDWGLNALLAYVYSSYPELTGNSVIKDEVLG